MNTPQTERSTVAVIRCPDYDPEGVYAAIRRGVELIGGLDRFVRPGEHILLKPNILASESPDKAVTTHPSVLAGCVRLLREGGATVSFGDSPGFEGATSAARGSGLQEAGTAQGGTFVPFAGAKPLPLGADVSGPSLPIAEAAHECDGLVNLPKAKTHQLTRITGSVKNLFGCIPGQRKALYHVQYPDVHEFSSFLAQLALRLQPRLHVMDGIVAMEGNGPRGGDPRALRVLLLSVDPVAVDATFCRLVDMDPTLVPTVLHSWQSGLGRYREDEIDLVGDPLQDLVCPSFKMVRKPVYDNATWAYFRSIKNLVVPRPAIDAGTCVRCGRCVEACPVPGKALQFENGNRARPPVYDYGHCIRCYCCLETCPHRAIERHTPLLGRILRMG
jgi:uncharacterized protein (DUF362 family)/ferredoxin